MEERRNDDEPSKIISFGDLILEGKSEVVSLATIACCVLQPTKDAQNNAKLRKGMEFSNNQFAITQGRNEQQHHFVHDVNKLPKPKAKIKNKRSSAETSTTFNSQIGHHLGLKTRLTTRRTNMNLTRRPPSRNCPISKRNHEPPLKPLA